MAEIKRNKDRIDMKDLQEKVLALPSKFAPYQIRMEGLSLKDV